MANSPSAPADDIVPIIPNDSNDLATPARSIVVEVSGTVKVTTAAGQQRTISAALVIAGQPIPVQVKRIWATGTTATGIWALT